MKEEYVFKPRARLLLQLGEQLIRNDNIAVLELVKNAHDADANKASIVLENADDKTKGRIVIEDDGTGMDMDIIKNEWMEPGSDYKEKIYLQKKRTEKFDRMPLGEKGIGRFAVHKLGNVIELTTRKKSNKEIFIRIDWRDFEKARYLDDAPINIIERTPQIFKGSKTGTQIIVKDLKRNWIRGMVRELYRSVNSMCTPFDSSDPFSINFETDKEEWLEGLLNIEEIEEYALFKFRCEVERDQITKLEYSFTPWPAMIKLKPRRITHKQIPGLLRMVYRDKNSIDLSKQRIGKIIFEGMIFDRDSRILALGVQDRPGFKEYLDMNGGIRVYRDDVRVYDYGESENDWLSLDIRRVNLPTKKISNNIIIASVSIIREHSADLIEKTNREGFIENEAYLTFKAAVLFTLDRIESLRETDKNLIRTYYGPTPKTEPVVSQIEELRTVVEEKVKEPALKKEVTIYLDKIEANYRNINEVLLRSAGAGLSLSVVIHEIQKIVAELKKVIETHSQSRRITFLIKHLSQLVEGYTLVVRKSGRQKWDIKKLIDQAVFNTEYRFKSHKIDVIKKYKDYSGNSELSCARNLIIGTMINILDNSIWWFDYAKIRNKKVFISISDEIPGYLNIVIADNGPGFALPIGEITRPFVTGKPDGMGIGLHIADEIMKTHKGKLIFPEWGDLTIPGEFKDGATIVLAFRIKEGAK